MQPDPAQPPPASQQQTGQYDEPITGQPVHGYATQPVYPSDRGMGTLAHIGGPLLGFIVPLIVWAVTKDKARAQDPLLEEHLREAMNAGLTFLIAIFVHSILTIVLIGCLTGFIHWVLYLVWAIQANSALNRGESYQYPLTIRFINQ